MTAHFLFPRFILLCLTASLALGADHGVRKRATFQRLKAHIDAVPAIDTHNHLWPFEILPGYHETAKGHGMTLASLWRNSYFNWVNPVPRWGKTEPFAEWWQRAQPGFDRARAMSFYRYQLPAFKDLYGVDFETLDAKDAEQLSGRVWDNYKNQKWLYHVITERANIELMFNDPYWGRYKFTTYYPWEVMVLNVTPLVRATHPSEFNNPWDSPFKYALKHKLPMKTLDDYLAVLDHLFATGKKAGAVCLKTTLAYQRTLRFENVPKATAAAHFGKTRANLTAAQAKEFEDFIMWRLVELSAKHALPFQIHTGQARIQGSDPMHLVDLIAANPKTKFILFHGGFPWIAETGVIVMRYPRNVWVDSCWLPTLSYSTAVRAYREWLEVMPSDRIMWGADCNHAEGIYGATVFTRRAVAEALAGMVEDGNLREDHARRIGRQIMRDNALQLFPQLKQRLWKHKGKLTPPEK